MLETLADRLKQAMAGPPKVTQAALAKACGVKAPSVNNWVSGKTKSIEGVYLVRAAAFLKVRPRWLSEGVGPREIDNPFSTMHTAAEPGARFINMNRGRARLLLDSLPDHLVDEAISHMEWLLERDKKTSDHISGGRGFFGRT